MYQRLQTDLLKFKPKHREAQEAPRIRKTEYSDVKMMGSLMMLSTDTSFDTLDHVYLMSQESAVVYFHTFCDYICNLHGEQFLNRRPEAVKLKKSVDIYTKNGFPGVAGCIDS